MKWGEAPCDACNRFSIIRLIGTSEPAKDGGKYFKCAPGQFCPDCGQQWNWMHQPPADDLAWPNMVTVEPAVGVVGGAVEVEFEVEE